MIYNKRFEWMSADIWKRKEYCTLCYSFCSIIYQIQILTIPTIFSLFCSVQHCGGEGGYCTQWTWIQFPKKRFRGSSTVIMHTFSWHDTTRHKMTTRIESNRTEPNRTELNQIELNWIELNRIESNRIESRITKTNDHQYTTQNTTNSHLNEIS